MDSEPLLQKNTLAGKALSTSSFASLTWGSVWYRLEMCISFAVCCATAPMTSGTPWPREFTAMPPRKSRYRLPSRS